MGFWKSILTAFEIDETPKKPPAIDKLWGYLDVREEEMLRMSYLNDYDRGRADAYGEVESYMRTLFDTAPEL